MNKHDNCRYLGIILIIIAFMTNCQDLRFGDDFLEKPPADDVDIDFVFSSAEYARRTLWAAYETLPYGLTCEWNSKLGQDILECLTDLNHSTMRGQGGGHLLYYTGDYSPDLDNNKSWNSHSTIFGFTRQGSWKGIRRAYLFIQNVDKVPDMEQSEKEQLKAEAKMIIAIHYCDMFRYYGGLPWINHAYSVNEDFSMKRSTALETLDNIVNLLDEASEVLPWIYTGAELLERDGRMTKSGAMGLKARILLFGASPLFNDHVPYLDGEASAQHLTWFGNYNAELWNRALIAHEAFFNEMAKNTGVSLVVNELDPKEAFRKAYFDRGNGETLISSRKFYQVPGFWADFTGFSQCVGDHGAGGPTTEFVNYFGMENGKPITDPTSGYDPEDPFKNRDPRMYVTLVTNGNPYHGRTAEIYIGGKDNQTYASDGPWITGYALRKFVLDGGGAVQYEWSERDGKITQWPILRLSELYLGYAEAICQVNNGPTSLAYQYINAVRRRGGIGDLQQGLNKEEFIEACLTERVCELSFEEVRWFDMIRYKREDLFKKRLHRVIIRKKENATDQYTYEYEELPRRYWATSFSPKWYLTAFPPDEINKGYGLIQNPGW